MDSERTLAHRSFCSLECALRQKHTASEICTRCFRVDLISDRLRCTAGQVGLSNRAMELFDWLRGLEPSHDLAALCDVYTCALLTLCPQGQKKPS